MEKSAISIGKRLSSICLQKRLKTKVLENPRDQRQLKDTNHQPTWFTFKSMLKFCRPCFGMPCQVWFHAQTAVTAFQDLHLHSMGFAFGNIICVKLIEDTLLRCIIISQLTSMPTYAIIRWDMHGLAYKCIHQISRPGDWKGPYPNREHLRGLSYQKLIKCIIGMQSKRGHEVQYFFTTCTRA